MRTLHESSVDKRRTPDPAKTKSTKVAHKKNFSSSYADPSGSSIFSSTRPGRGYQEFMGAV
jgi:hypothetical protein